MSDPSAQALALVQAFVDAVHRTATTSTSTPLSDAIASLERQFYEAALSVPRQASSASALADICKRYLETAATARPPGGGAALIFEELCRSFVLQYQQAYIAATAPTPQDPPTLIIEFVQALPGLAQSMSSASQSAAGMALNRQFYDHCIQAHADGSRSGDRRAMLKSVVGAAQKYCQAAPSLCAPRIESVRAACFQAAGSPSPGPAALAQACRRQRAARI